MFYVVLSVLLQYTDSDYPFGIFKLFLTQHLFLLKCLYQAMAQTLYSNMTSFFRFVSNRTIYRLGIISLAHAPVHVTTVFVLLGISELK